MGQTIAEKILSNHNIEKKKVFADDFVDASIDCAMSHDNTGLISSIFKKIGKKKVWNPNDIVIVLDHRTPANTEQTAINHKLIREFVYQQKIPHFFDVGQGICHQLLVEHGFIRPGMLIVGEGQLLVERKAGLWKIVQPGSVSSTILYRIRETP
ncbi:MAG: aconitase family protein [Thermoplasmatota archaeon]